MWAEELSDFNCISSRPPSEPSGGPEEFSRPTGMISLALLDIEVTSDSIFSLTTL